MNELKWIPLWLVSLLVIYVLKDCADHVKIEKARQEVMDILDDTVKVYRDRMDRVVSEKRALEVSSDRVLRENDSLKELARNVKPRVIVEVNTVYRDTGTIKFDTVYRDLNIPFKSVDRWRNVSGTVMGDGIHFNEFEVFNTQTLLHGESRTWFMGRKSHVVRVVNDNPLVTVTGLKPLVIEEKKRWYEKWWLWGIAGFAGGILITK